MAPTTPTIRMTGQARVSPTTMRSRKRAQRTIVKQAALNVIKLKKAGGKYGYLTKVIKQYDVCGITREQLKHAVNKIEKNEVQEVSQHPAAVLLGGSISPMSTLTSERGLDNPIMTAALEDSITTAATTTATTPPRGKGLFRVRKFHAMSMSCPMQA
jgi:hypothetical protein